VSQAIKLTSREFFLASEAGLMRTEHAQRKGQTRQYEPEQGLIDSYGQDIDAACAEMAAAHVLGFFPLGLTAERLPDLYDGATGTNLEVRHTRLPQGHLIVRKRDLEGGVDGPGIPRQGVCYVFVTGAFYEYIVHGWALETDVVQERYLHKNNGEPDAWWIPQGDLRSLDDINERGSLC